MRRPLSVLAEFPKQAAPVPLPVWLRDVLGLGPNAHWQSLIAHFLRVENFVPVRCSYQYSAHYSGFVQRRRLIDRLLCRKALKLLQQL